MTNEITEIEELRLEIARLKSAVASLATADLKLLLAAMAFANDDEEKFDMRIDALEKSHEDAMRVLSELHNE